MDDLSKLIREAFEYSMTDIHTALPGVVVKYDANTRRADIQPSLKRKMPNGKFMDFPVVPDVPVIFPGTKNCTIHFPLENDDEVLLIINERGTDTWKSKGGKGIEETDPRRFDLQDCFVIPGLQPVKFQDNPADGLSIQYKDFKTNVVNDKATMQFKSIKTETDGSKITSEFVNLESKGDIKHEGNYELKGNLTAEGNHVFKGGSVKIGGMVAPTGSGALCGLPKCVFSGADHVGDIAQGT
jgi:hypothetical protein